LIAGQPHAVCQLGARLEYPADLTEAARSRDMIRVVFSCAILASASVWPKRSSSGVGADAGERSLLAPAGRI
jgi:hypothetical protein